MTRIRLFFWIFVFFVCKVCGESGFEFDLADNETMTKIVDLENRDSQFLFLQTSSPITVSISGNAPNCSELVFIEHSGNSALPIFDYMWQQIFECGDGKSINVTLEAKEKATGSLKFLEVSKSQTSYRSQASESFSVSENNPYSKKIKLESLLDNVEIHLTSDNAENILEVYITFCPTNKGILYTSSYAPNVDISLKSPRMELYYDAYSCDSNIAFYSNSSKPVSPLIIRLESQFSINGTMTVLINGKTSSSDFESHVADYETGTFTLEKDETKTLELEYPPNVENIQAFFDVVTGSISAYISPCESEKSDIFVSKFSSGSQQISIDLEQLMTNTSCSLSDINPSTIFLTVKAENRSTLKFWIPGQKATWQIAIILAVVIVVLAVAMVLIVCFGRRKTGKLVINYSN